MTLCGIVISGNTAHLVVIDGTQADFTVANVEPRSISLNDPESATDLRSFRETFQAFVDERHIETIAIKSRVHKGPFAGGPTSFKIEAIVQLLSNCTAELISPVTIASILKRKPAVPPAHLKKYQHDAFRTAYAFLQR